MMSAFIFWIVVIAVVAMGLGYLGRRLYLWWHRD